ncbi:30S ribosomal protein S13 [Candidatus Nomurabacteria bacterium RIFCSPHIGHO2_02_FULL_33_12]|uniref:Small ribosomal subunit protein uS13 n=1 Tax=Candidatus Nomurabacteria bacterium RIFCSPLOWO2_01_FULL_33_17 TaxID=1801764 RepID=A0A1F6WQV5_9BACT|nr:MAG: 30S ribosomal protein S13 [Candidatus Nomurabacteria bacterium RIFCSPHIGHO2_02_FULL_33_12]OGI84194.1 MAG: 30S ribosomal protein S13 [Candidatus Nomurabacteria bacterium RIFCSPLOWO2_01_FULL_33_17]
MRILGITIPAEKKLDIGLTVLFGVGRKTAEKVLAAQKIKVGSRPADLTMDQENAIRRVIEEMKIEGNLKREISGNIKRLKDIKSYRGSRHTKKLPIRGQRTKTNSRTLRGNVRATMASGRRKESKT